jgi:uncharacterized membrane protein
MIDTRCAFRPIITGLSVAACLASGSEFENAGKPDCYGVADRC